MMHECIHILFLFSIDIHRRFFSTFDLSKILDFFSDQLVEPVSGVIGKANAQKKAPKSVVGIMPVVVKAGGFSAKKVRFPSVIRSLRTTLGMPWVPISYRPFRIQ